MRKMTDAEEHARHVLLVTNGELGERQTEEQHLEQKEEDTDK